MESFAEPKPPDAWETLGEYLRAARSGTQVHGESVDNNQG